MASPQPTFFATPAKWRAWLARHHATAPELVVGFYKKGSGRPSITWPESVDEALCYGWIDGVRRSLGEGAYTIRFTPRRPGSTWSAVNTRRVAELKKLGKMAPAGLKAFAGRIQSKTAIYAYEQDRKTAQLPPKYLREFRKNAAAWTYYRTKPPWYQHVTAWWIVSAKKEATRLKRLTTLIADSAAGRSIAGLNPTRGDRKDG